MSVTFTLRGVSPEREIGDDFNIANGNARDLLAFIGLDPGELYSEIRGRELAERVRAARAQPADRGRFGYIDTAPGKATLVYGGRRPERMTEYLDALDKLAAEAGDLGVVIWF